VAKFRLVILTVSSMHTINYFLMIQLIIFLLFFLLSKPHPRVGINNMTLSLVDTQALSILLCTLDAPAC